jgi:hypothetical protein
MKMEISTIATHTAVPKKWESMTNETEAQPGPMALIQRPDSENTAPETPRPDDGTRNMTVTTAAVFSPEEMSASLQLSFLKLQFEIFRNELEGAHPEFVGVNFEFGLDKHGQIEIIDASGQLPSERKAKLAQLLSDYHGFGATARDLVNTIKQSVIHERSHTLDGTDLAERPVRSLIDFGTILNSGDAMSELKSQIINALNEISPTLSEIV